VFLNNCVTSFSSPKHNIDWLKYAIFGVRTNQHLYKVHHVHIQKNNQHHTIQGTEYITGFCLPKNSENELKNNSEKSVELTGEDLCHFDKDLTEKFKYAE
jgi:hypothetical protein